ncbi:ANR family transcriptional regulator [Providencia stuartii]|nr:ANR family transcriptional regulator [Providencia stuartii]MDN0004848.1 ANR family transcriptional regulator [Providencia stuartii]MDN7224906.1 ANR family transcriptional regulator [Providencia stuartii]MDQ5990358.1 ANR family transcriptional regulator [Providencia stuartii]MDT1065392.1 ANR family transcriptional regulator [Providencia stuartii]
MVNQNNDSPLYLKVARDAIRLERSGKYFEASKAWSQANRLSRVYRNQIWCERRADFCYMQIQREKYKLMADDESTENSLIWHISAVSFI